MEVKGICNVEEKILVVTHVIARYSRCNHMVSISRTAQGQVNLVLPQFLSNFAQESLKFIKVSFLV